MNKPPKYEILAFIKDQRQLYKPTALGFKILDYLESLVNKHGGQTNGRKETSQKP